MHLPVDTRLKILRSSSTIQIPGIVKLLIYSRVEYFSWDLQTNETVILSFREQPQAQDPLCKSGPGFTMRSECPVPQSLLYNTSL